MRTSDIALVFASSALLLGALAACSTASDASEPGPAAPAAAAPPPSGDGTGADAGTSSGSVPSDAGAGDGSSASDAGAEAAPLTCNGQCLYVRAGATGAGNGADWTNAYPKLPATLQRGRVYLVADGTYGSHTFDDPVNGTDVITIRKATVQSHGTDAGWSDAYGDGQAVFTHWSITSDHYVFEGARRDADWYTGSVGQYGLSVSGSSPIRLDDGNGVGGDDLTFHDVDVAGGGRDTGDGDDVVYGLTGNSNITFRACALHDSDRTIFLMRGNWKNLTVDHSYLARNTSTPAMHGEMLSMTDSTDVTWSNNVMVDIEGTAFIAGLNGGTASNWDIHGNVALHTAAYAADTGRKAGHNFGVSGFVFIAHDASNDNKGMNIRVVNNTFYDMKGLWSGVIVQAGTGNVVQNNLWYGSVVTNNSGVAADYNWFYATPGSNGTHDETCTSSCNVFADAAKNDFHLTRATQAGTTLASPFDRDPDGLTRGADGTWDRGAYERK